MEFIRAQVLNTGFLVGLGCGACLVFLLRLQQRQQATKAPGPVTEEESPLDDRGDYKMVLVVRTDLKMGKGKIAAQCSHAAVAAYKQARRWHPAALEEWENSGQAKITLKVSNEKELRALADTGRSKGIGVSLIRDAGRTQIEAGTTTVMGLGPGPSKMLDEVTGHLSLL
ncbi:hypothetical protein B566_EDAN007215 [Ephemera danica]|nr:hypothetical protein B566_EDAN007215 [Ephemera danica]